MNFEKMAGLGKKKRKQAEEENPSSSSSSLSNTVRMTNELHAPGFGALPLLLGNHIFIQLVELDTDRMIQEKLHMICSKVDPVASNFIPSSRKLCKGFFSKIRILQGTHKMVNQLRHCNEKLLDPGGNGGKTAYLCIFTESEEGTLHFGPHSSRLLVGGSKLGAPNIDKTELLWSRRVSAAQEGNLFVFYFQISEREEWIALCISRNDVNRLLRSLPPLTERQRKTCIDFFSALMGKTADVFTLASETKYFGPKLVDKFTGIILTNEGLFFTTKCLTEIKRASKLDVLQQNQHGVYTQADEINFSLENQFSGQEAVISLSSLGRPGTGGERMRSNRSNGPYDAGTARPSMNHDTLRQYNWDGIAEMLLVPERIEQEEWPTYEQLLAVESNFFLGGLSYHDQHRDMRLDVDNMSYEELSALEERVGTVNTAVPVNVLAMCLKRSIYQDIAECGEDEIEDDVKCSIRQFSEREEWIVLCISRSDVDRLLLHSLPHLTERAGKTTCINFLKALMGKIVDAFTLASEAKYISPKLVDKFTGIILTNEGLLFTTKCLTEIKRASKLDILGLQHGVYLQAALDRALQLPNQETTQQQERPSNSPIYGVWEQHTCHSLDFMDIDFPSDDDGVKVCVGDGVKVGVVDFGRNIKSVGDNNRMKNLKKNS